MQCADRSEEAPARGEELEPAPAQMPPHDGRAQAAEKQRPDTLGNPRILQVLRAAVYLDPVAHVAYAILINGREAGGGFVESAGEVLLLDGGVFKPGADCGHAAPIRTEVPPEVQQGEGITQRRRIPGEAATQRRDPAEHLSRIVPLEAEKALGQALHLLGWRGALARQLIDQQCCLHHGGQRDGLPSKWLRRGGVHAMRVSITPPPRQHSP